MDWRRSIIVTLLLAGSLSTFGCSDEDQQRLESVATATEPIIDKENAHEPKETQLDKIIVGANGEDADLRSAIAGAPHNSRLILSSDAESFLVRDGPIVIDRPITIYTEDGAAPITTNGRHGTFVVTPGASLALVGVHIRNGAGSGAPAIENFGTLGLENIRIDRGIREFGPAAIKSHGVLLARGLHLEKNQANSGPGAIIIVSGQARLKDVMALNNTGSNGGVIENFGRLDIDRGYFAFNSAAEGGAIFNKGRLDIQNSAFWSNQGTGVDSFGGAILSESRAWITNTTFHDNRATFGSAIVADMGRLDLAHVTFHENPNRAGSDLYVGHQALLTIRNSILSGNDSTSLSVDVVGSGTVESLGGNVVPEPAGFWPDDIDGPDDHLGTNRFSTEAPVGADGWIQVVPLGESHPARQAVPSDFCQDAHGRTLHRDQVGNQRALHISCDSGAHQASHAAQPDSIAPGEEKVTEHAPPGTEP